MKRTIALLFCLLLMASTLAGCIIDDDKNSDKGEEILVESGGEFNVSVPSSVGNIIVKVQLPNTPRYESGAPIILEVGTFFTSNVPFYNTVSDILDEGFVYVTYIWPGTEERDSGMASEGEYDHGGVQCLSGLAGVIRYATGQITDSDGYSLADRAMISVNQTNVGLYAFSHPGIAMTNVLAKHGDTLGNLGWIVGRENPTVDTISSMEIGYWNGKNEATHNPLYSYPESYSPTELSLNYSLIKWNATWNEDGGDPGRPYWDLNENDILDYSDHVLSYQVPTFYGKRTYSMAMTQALLDSGTADPWPNDVNTVETVNKIWPERMTVNNYPEIKNNLPDLKVMLLFSDSDHVQVANDSPHIHQAWDGFHHGASLWVRLNPDAEYSSHFGVVEGTEHDANTSPSNWSNAYQWGHSSNYTIRTFPLIAISEMADRQHFGNWNNDLETYLLDGI